MEAVSRFTIDGSDALEQRLQMVCEAAAAGVRARFGPGRLEGLLLGGGYGRGEGGVLSGSEGDEPYNDLEFYVLLRGDPRVNEKIHRKSLHGLAEKLEKAAGIEVEFKILSRRKLESSPCSMFYHDLVMGHKRLVGEEHLLSGCEHHRRSEDIPLFEATRLLMNRCTGLLFSWAKLASPQFTAESADFVARNQAKAQLAFGDVALTAHRLYHSSCRVRHERLKRLSIDCDAPLSELVERHGAGVQFKLHPQRSRATRAQLLAQQTDISDFAARMWLWLEGRRLGRRFASAREYALSSVNKCEETHPLRNLAINAAVFRGRAFSGPGLFRYPRERLLEALTLLLWDPQLAGDPAGLRQVQRRVGARSAAYPELVAAYTNIWRRFN